MPIVEPAPWRHQYFSHVACPPDVFIPTDDPEAWAWNPRHRWVFDKLQVALSQGLEAAPHGLEPSYYPVFSKPIYNFGGMGAGSRILTSREDYLAHLIPGHMWMPLREGRHVSTDVAVLNGEARWIRHATGLATSDGMFDYWTVQAQSEPELETFLSDWIRRHLADYSGMLNLETIGATIIEAHLRFADQWPDLYGDGWVEALVRLYRDHAWDFADAHRRDGFSMALFLPHGRRYRYPPQTVVADVLRIPNVLSMQITFHADRLPEAHSMPPGGFRVALINAIDLNAAFEARDILRAWFCGPEGTT